jgi:HAD superfamily hydrolase (TIGR01509 family)
VTLALVFDLDGVIVDSNPVHEVAWREYAARFGVTLDGGLRERMYGKRNDEILRFLFGDHLSEEEILARGAAKEQLFRELMGPQLKERLVPGVAAFLERHRDMPIGLASNAERPNVDFVLDHSGLRKYFRVVLDGFQALVPKPDPEIYLRTAELLKVDPRNCVIFEDSLSGVTAARGAGARVVGVTTTHRDLGKVDLLIEGFESVDLEPWLRQQQPVG